MDSSSSIINENDPDFDEKELTEKKVKLENGSYNFVFTNAIDDRHKEFWRCNVCDVVVGGSLSKHAMGKKHQANMALSAHPVYLWANAPVPKSTLGMKLAPGEPVPPGFEDEVRGVTEIQASLDAYHSGPLIGLGYLIELAAVEEEREPQYVCLLCDKRGDPRTFMAHLTSFNHRMAYLVKHFPTVYRALTPYTKQYRRNVQNVVTSICEQIEKRFGRMIPQAAERETFERKKHIYLDGVIKDNHPSERMGETFEYLVDKDVLTAGPIDPVIEIKKTNEDQFKGRQYRKTGSVPGCKDLGNPSKRDPSPPIVAAPEIKKSATAKTDRRSLSSISSISSSSLSSPRVSRSRSQSPRDNSRIVKRRYPENVTRRSRSRSRSAKRYYRRSRSYSRSPPPRYRREPYPPVPAPYYTTNVRNVESSRLPWQRPEYNRSRIHYQDRRSEGSKSDPMKNDRWDDFKKQASAIEEDMAKILEQHERNPEKHPTYPDEWKKFWNRRYKELQAENKDPTKHDFKPEWIDFWNKRMKEMHDADLKQKKDALRKRLNLPEEPSPISFKIGKKKAGSSEPGTTREKEKTIEPDVIVIDDSKDDEPPKDRKRSHSPWEPEPQRDRDRNNRDRDQRSQNRDRDRYIPEYSRDYYKAKPYREPPIEREYKRKVPLSPKYSLKEENEEINVVAILRLLCAVEEKLGSLGPKVIEMLSRALALEKKEANSSETLLDNEINCVLFETVKEKLKGQLLAGMVSPNAEKTFKSCIQKIASLLHFANERKKTKDKELAVKNKEPVKIPGIGAIDKGAIAKQIATALVAQGKTDVTQTELEQLINAVVGMAQASQATGKTISTATFVQQLSNPGKTDFSGILKQTMAAAVAAANKPEPVSSALQLLQSTSSSMVSNTPGLAAAGAMDSLSDAELKTLLQNFKDLSTDEQHSLITYLKKLEAKEPERVERLRKFVKLGPTNMADPEKAFPATTSGRTSPFSNREAGANPTLDEIDKRDVIKPLSQHPKAAPETLKIDSDEDEDYSFEDVFRAASKNVNDKQMEDRRLEEAKKSEKAKEQANINLNDAKMLIANLMGQLGKKNNTSINLLGLGTSLSNLTPKPLVAATPVTPNLLNFPTTSTIPTIGAPSQQFTNANISNNPINPMNSIQYPIGANQMNPNPVGINQTNTNPVGINQINPNLIGANQMNPNPIGVNPNSVGANQINSNSIGSNQTNPNSPAQYNYPQNNRQYNTSYDGFHSQNDYHSGNQSMTGNMNYNQPQDDHNTSGYGGGSAYNMNTYGQQQMQNTRQAAPHQYGRSAPSGQQQYQQYDSRQNYY